MGIASLILGIVATVFCWFPYLGLPCGIVAVVLGIIQIVKSKKAEEPQKKGKSIAGIITGAIGIVVSSIVLIAAVVLVNKASNALNDLSDYDYDYDYDWSDYDYDWDM